MRRKRIVWPVALMLAIAPGQAGAAAIGTWGVDLSDQDRSVRAGDDFYRRHNANVSRAVHALGSEATEAYEGARVRRLRAHRGGGGAEFLPPSPL